MGHPPGIPLKVHPSSDPPAKRRIYPKPYTHGPLLTRLFHKSVCCHEEACKDCCNTTLWVRNPPVHALTPRQTSELQCLSSSSLLPTEPLCWLCSQDACPSFARLSTWCSHGSRECWSVPGPGGRHDLHLLVQRRRGVMVRHLYSPPQSWPVQYLMRDRQLAVSNVLAVGMYFDDKLLEELNLEELIHHTMFTAVVKAWTCCSS